MSTLRGKKGRYNFFSSKTEFHGNLAVSSPEQLHKKLQANIRKELPDLTNVRKALADLTNVPGNFDGNRKVKENSEITEQDNLPNIDGECNPLEVSEYVDEIYQYYWNTEALTSGRENYLSSSDITPPLRGILINWLIEVHLTYGLMPKTLYLAVSLLDQYLYLVTIKKNELQLVGVTALLLASKYEDVSHLTVKELISNSAVSCTREQILAMEKLILGKLKFRLNDPTPYVFMVRFLKAAQADKKELCGDDIEIP